ncbi:MAG: 3-isopropylmalate dehydratase [Acetobacteraceae bacterium]
MSERDWMLEGRSWLFAEANLNTDLMMPPRGYTLPLAERAKLVFSANRPGWAEAVRASDILIAGRNFGAGSSRPAPQLFRVLGISALVAESINGLFFRNCINYALPAMECPGVAAAVTEGDRVRVEIRAGRFTNLQSRRELRGSAMPAMLLEILEAGGLYQQLERSGAI